MDLISKIDLKFTSGNSVPVERASISADDWDQLKRMIEELSVLPKKMNISFPPTPMDLINPDYLNGKDFGLSLGWNMAIDAISELNP